MSGNTFIKGLVTGACVGIAVSSIINPMDNSDVKRITKSANRAWTTVGSIVDGALGNFR